jgi:hypothetical protein
MLRAVRFIAVVIVILSIGARAAAAKPARAALALVSAEARDATTRERVSRPASLKAGRAHESELAACAALMKVDIADAVESVLVSVSPKVGADGRVTSVDVVTDALTGYADDHPSAAATCVGPIVARWTLPDRDLLVLRFALVPPVRRDPKLPGAYVQALRAVCSARSSGGAQDQAKAIADALRAHPSDELRSMFRDLGGWAPEQRVAIVRAVLANAGLRACPSLGI